MKPLPKLLLFAGVCTAAVLEVKHLMYTGVLQRPSILKTVVPVQAEEISATVLSASGQVKAAPLPGSRAVPPCADGNTRNCLSGDVQEVEIWAWNANGGFLFSVGDGASPGGRGIATSRDSLQAKYGVPVTVTRQDDTGQMKTDLLDFVSRYASDPHATGTKFITLMADGYAQFAHDLNPKLAKICPDCITEGIAIFGYSRGEDGFWGPKKWKDNPQSAKGGLVIGVLRDGDWNIAMKWAAQNGIPNNPDDQVYDPDALNWINADSYTKAAEMLVQGTCPELPAKGKVTSGAKKKVCAEGVVTWTPGDVTIAKKKGGVIPILTTRQSVFQMPCLLVGIRRWDRSHREEISKMLTAAFEGADQVRANPAALRRMGEISQSLYKEQGADADYWIRYYKGVTEPDATGTPVPLGGSAVSNLADNLQSFGLNGGPNLLAATYTTFGKIVVQQYPTMYPGFPPAAEVLDPSYVRAISGASAPTTTASIPIGSGTSPGPMRSIEGRRDYSIHFATGSDKILSDSISTLNDAADQIMITNYIVAVHGHTDNTGSETANLTLSERRAESVRSYLQRRGVANSIRSYGHGQEEPIASNATAEGKANNRRVQIVLGTN